MVTKSFFSTVGELRKLLEGVPDDRQIIAQVIGKDNGAWNMWPSFTPQVPQGTVACLQMEHDQLVTLPEPNTETCKCKEFHGIYADTKICCSKCHCEVKSIKLNKK